MFFACPVRPRLDREDQETLGPAPSFSCNDGAVAMQVQSGKESNGRRSTAEIWPRECTSNLGCNYHVNCGT